MTRSGMDGDFIGVRKMITAMMSIFLLNLISNEEAILIIGEHLYGKYKILAII